MQEKKIKNFIPKEQLLAAKKEFEETLGKNPKGKKILNELAGFDKKFVDFDWEIKDPQFKKKYKDKLSEISKIQMEHEKKLKELEKIKSDYRKKIKEEGQHGV